jgi:hypothetical protein
MSVVHYAFERDKKRHSITFDGASLSVVELKSAIVRKHFADKITDSKVGFDLMLKNKVNGHNYTMNGYLIPKNTTVSARQIRGSLELAEVKVQTTNAEDQKVLELMYNHREQLQDRQVPNQYTSQGEPPPGYKCHRCGSKSHYIRNCPTNGDPSYDIRKLKAPTGIPRSQLVQIDAKKKLSSDPDETVPGGTLFMPDGSYATHRPNEGRFFKKLSQTSGQRADTASDKRMIGFLKCPLCKNFMRDPVKASRCCYNTFCRSCLEQALRRNNSCPGNEGTCNDPIDPDDLVPNTSLANKIAAHLQSIGQSLPEPPKSSSHSQQGRGQAFTGRQNFRSNHEPHDPYRNSRYPPHSHSRGSRDGRDGYGYYTGRDGYSSSEYRGRRERERQQDYDRQSRSLSPRYRGERY